MGNVELERGGDQFLGGFAFLGEDLRLSVRTALTQLATARVAMVRVAMARVAMARVAMAQLPLAGLRFG